MKFHLSKGCFLNIHFMSTPARTLSWRDDLKKAGNVTDAQHPDFEMLLSWFENWRVGRSLSPGREAAQAFWAQQAKSKPRAPWQIEQWKEALGWYLE